MPKFSSLVKVVVLSALVAPIAFAGSESIVDSTFAEPIYLSVCGIILLAFGMMKDKKTDSNTSSS